MGGNRVVVYKGPGKVAIEELDYPKLEIPQEVADGMGIAARYSPDACNQPGNTILNAANGTAASTLIISGLRNTLRQMLHGSDLITGLYTASTMVDNVL